MEQKACLLCSESLERSGTHEDAGAKAVVTLPGALSVTEDDRDWILAAVLRIHSSALLLHPELANATTYTSSILWSHTTTLQMRNAQ